MCGSVKWVILFFTGIFFSPPCSLTLIVTKASVMSDEFLSLSHGLHQQMQFAQLS